MNRAQRRFEQRLRYSTGGFVSELRKRRDQAAYAEALRAQMQEEANGRPIPGDVLERMTKEKPEDELWQIMVHDRAANVMVPMGPMMSKDACGISVEAINRQIASGQRRDWTKAEAYPMTPIYSQGAN
jgi:protoheme ferro-lyase